MSIFKSIGKAVSNSITATTDTISGITGLSIEAITDNPVTRGISDARLLGKIAREERQAKALAKKLLKLQKKQAELLAQPDNDF